MQSILHAMKVIEMAYCTQQTGGLTRGITLRAIHARPSIPRAEIRGGADLQHCVHVATVRFYVAGPSAPEWCSKFRGFEPRIPGRPASGRHAMANDLSNEFYGIRRPMGRCHDSQLIWFLGDVIGPLQVCFATSSLGRVLLKSRA